MIPSSGHLQFSSVPRRFNEGPFVGNRWMVSLVYAEPGGLCVTLDHADLWELRHTSGEKPEMSWRELLRAGNYAGLPPSYPAMARGPARVKLPSLSLLLGPGEEIKEFFADLDLQKAEVRVVWRTARSRHEVVLWCASEKNILVIEGRNLPQVIARGWPLDTPRLETLVRWGYSPAEAHASGIVQAFGDRRAVVGVLRRSGVVLASLAVDGDPQPLGAFARNLAAERAAHRRSWQAYWSSCTLCVPEPALQEATDLERYKLFCQARPDGPVVTLQGVWNDTSALPACYGDLHNNLNVQACYWPAFKLGRPDMARPYIRRYNEALPHFQWRAEVLCGAKNAASIPQMMAPDGCGVPDEWNFWNCLLGSELFVACDFIWYARYSGTAEARAEVLPLLRAVAALYRHVGKKDRRGRLHFPLGHSPEIFRDGGLFMGTDAAFVIGGLRFLLGALIQWDRRGRDAWKDFLHALPPLPQSGRGIDLFPGVPLNESHRHFANLYSLFPANSLDPAKPEDAALIQRSLDTITRFGFTEFAAWSFPYLAILAARGGRGEMAAGMLEMYRRAFRSPNSFTVNGDPYRSGFIAASESSAGEAADVFTLEAGLIVPAAICEMLVHQSCGNLRLLPALPRAWDNIEARGLGLEGGQKIDLCVQGGKLKSHRMITPQ